MWDRCNGSNSQSIDGAFQFLNLLEGEKQMYPQVETGLVHHYEEKSVLARN